MSHAMGEIPHPDLETLHNHHHTRTRVPACQVCQKVTEKLSWPQLFRAILEVGVRWMKRNERDLQEWYGHIHSLTWLRSDELPRSVVNDSKHGMDGNNKDDGGI